MKSDVRDTTLTPPQGPDFPVVTTPRVASGAGSPAAGLINAHHVRIIIDRVYHAIKMTGPCLEK
jgi:hypothetical protein